MDEKTRWMNEAVAVVDSFRLPGEMKIYPYSEVYQCYERQGNLDKALEVLQKYDSLAQLKNEAYLFADCYKGMMRVYTKWETRKRPCSIRTSSSGIRLAAQREESPR